MSDEAVSPQDSPDAVSNRLGLPRWVLPVATGIGGFVLGGLVVAAVGAAAAGLSVVATPTVFADAVSTCDLDDSPFAVVEDEGLTLTIESKGEDDLGGLTYEEQGCILDALNVPAAVLSHFGQTTSQDGRQTETWDGITLSWSYHPSRGADSVLTYDPQ